ncbi:hypothetical protein HYX10_01465 [Candidatus Woesearchaeota archaeon]|nr:hypothetical protein [Candidatus Woesearchaeota archaeon]
MSFVRVKRISGSEYAYLVENSWTQRGGRQKVAQYLGRVHRPVKAKSEGLAGFLNTAELGKHIRNSDFKAVAADLIKLELHNHDVKISDFQINFDGLSVKSSSGKNVAVAMNNGFLCSYTLKRLLEYKPEADYSGYVLADLITAAGILPEQEVFIKLYGKFRAKHEAAAAKKFEFYY